MERLTIAGFVEAVIWVAVRREDCDLVASVLESNSSVNHQTLGTADA
jgi:hypothetical protein